MEEKGAGQKLLELQNYISTLEANIRGIEMVKPGSIFEFENHNIESISVAIGLLCKELEKSNVSKIPALAGAVKDLTIAKAVLLLIES